MADRTKPYAPSGYYLWIARSGKVKDEARFGSSETKRYIDFEGDLMVPGPGGRFQRKPMRRDERLSFDPRSNLFAMITIARDGVPPTEDEVKAGAVSWEEVLDVPLVVRVDNDAYHPKTGNGDERDETVTYYASRQRGAPQGWPAGIPLPEGVRIRQAAPPPREPEAPPPAAARPQPRQERPQGAQPTPIRAGHSNPRAAPTEAPPDAQRRRQHPQPRRTALPEGWHQMKALVAKNLSAALQTFGWQPPLSPEQTGKVTPSTDEEQAAAVEAFWQYFDGVPALTRIKHVRPDGSAGIYWTPEHGATEDALALAAEALSRFLQGQDVRPPMPVRKEDGS